VNQNCAAVFVVWGNAFLADKTLEPSLAHSAQITRLNLHYQAISLFDPIPSSGLDGKSHTGNVQNCTISGFPDPAAPLVRKGSNFKSLLCGLSPPVSPSRSLAHGYTF